MKPLVLVLQQFSGFSVSGITETLSGKSFAALYHAEKRKRRNPERTAW